MGESRSRSDVDVVLASSAFVHSRAVVQRMIDDGIYPPRDPNRIVFEFWNVIAALFIAKPYWLLDDAEELTDRVLRAVCCGQITAGIVGYDARERMTLSSQVDNLRKRPREDS